MPGYQTRIETVRVGGIDYRIECLSDRQQFADADGAAERAGISSATWSIFGQLWPSGWALAQAVDSLPVEGLRILEVGCGLALASLVLARRGVDITASDQHPLAAAFLASNAQRNNIPMPKYCELSWADEATQLGRFDLIIGSDVMYERGHAELVAGVIARHAQVRAAVLICDPGRGQSGRLARLLVPLGFAGAIAPIALGPDQTPPFSGRMLHYAR